MPAVALSPGLQSASPDVDGAVVESPAFDGSPDVPGGRESGGQLVLEERFSIVPEWVLDADVSDAAVRLYAVLLRFGASSGQRMPSRRTLAERLRKKSVDSVDRALKELVAIGAVEVTRRTRDGLNLTNRYLVRSTRPGSSPAPVGGAAGVAARMRPPRTSRRRRRGASAATARLLRGGRRGRGGRTDLRPGLAARVRRGWPQGCGPTQSS